MEDSDDEIPTLQDLDDSTGTTEGDDEVPILQNAPHATHDEVSPLPPVPVTILTGFLGSGKTTLVRHLLTAPHKRRIAVIENEFGGGDESDARLAARLGLAVDDASTLSVETMIARDGTDGSNLADFIELPNGCVCCTVKDSLVETLELLLAKRTDLDYILIEASGMADPGPVASIFWLDAALDSRLRLDGIVTCVDAKNLGFQLESTSSSSDPATAMGSGSSEEHAGGGDEAARQIAFADRIIVNKVDLLPPSQNHAAHNNATTALEDVLREIKAINPTAPIKTALYSNIEDLDWILNAKCFDAERVKDVEAAFQHSAMEADAAMPRRTAALHSNLTTFRGGTCSNPACIIDHSLNDDFCGLCTEPPPPFVLPHRHTSAVGTVALSGRGSADLRRLNAWLASVLWPDQDESDKVLRARLEDDLRHATSRMSKATPQARGQKQTVYRVKGVMSVGHALDEGTGTVVPASNDWVDEGLAAGWVCAEDGLDARRFIVQAVNDLWDVLPASQNLRWEASETRCCKLIVIGKWLDEGQLREGFRDCFLDPLKSGS